MDWFSLVLVGGVDITPVFFFFFFSFFFFCWFFFFLPGAPKRAFSPARVEKSRETQSTRARHGCGGPAGCPWA